MSVPSSGQRARRRGSPTNNRGSRSRAAPSARGARVGSRVATLAMHADDVAALTAWREVDPALASLWPATAGPDSWDGVRVGADGRVTRLERSGQGLGGEVPAAVGRLVALEVLALDDNAVTALPPELGRLARLAELDVSGTHLETLPREMGSLVSLEELHACDAKLTSVPPELGRLAALRKLDLRVHALTTPRPSSTSSGSTCGATPSPPSPSSTSRTSARYTSTTTNSSSATSAARPFASSISRTTRSSDFPPSRRSPRWRRSRSTARGRRDHPGRSAERVGVAGGEPPGGPSTRRRKQRDAQSPRRKRRRRSAPPVMRRRANARERAHE